jgi:hypothetical protein
VKVYGGSAEGEVRGVDDLGEEVAVFSGAFLACAQRQDCEPVVCLRLIFHGFGTSLPSHALPSESSQSSRPFQTTMYGGTSSP